MNIKEKFKKAKEGIAKVARRVKNEIEDNKEALVAAGILAGTGALGIFAIKKGSQMIEAENQKIIDQMNDSMVEGTVVNDDGTEVHGKWLDLGEDGKIFFAEDD